MRTTIREVASRADVSLTTVSRVINNVKAVRPEIRSRVIKAMTEATLIVLVGCYYGYNASGGPVGVGTATAKSMVLNIVGVHLIGMLGTQLFWGANPRAPIGG